MQTKRINFLQLGGSLMTQKRWMLLHGLNQRAGTNRDSDTNVTVVVRKNSVITVVIYAISLHGRSFGSRFLPFTSCAAAVACSAFGWWDLWREAGPTMCRGAGRWVTLSPRSYP